MTKQKSYKSRNDKNKDGKERELDKFIERIKAENEALRNLINFLDKKK